MSMGRDTISDTLWDVCVVVIIAAFGLVVLWKWGMWE